MYELWGNEWVQLKENLPQRHREHRGFGESGTANAVPFTFLESR